jgi:hypothetical protein
MNTKTQAQTDSDASFFRELCKPANDAFDELERDYPKLFAEPPQELPRERDKAFQEELNAYENQRFDNVTSLTLAPKPWEPQEETVACEPPQEQTVAQECDECQHPISRHEPGGCTYGRTIEVEGIEMSGECGCQAVMVELDEQEKHDIVADERKKKAAEIDERNRQIDRDIEYLEWVRRL